MKFKVRPNAGAQALEEVRGLRRARMIALWETPGNVSRMYHNDSAAS